MKTCRKCRMDKPIDDFYRQKTSSDGHGAYCKACNKAEAKKYIKSNPEKAAAAKVRYKYGLSEEDRTALGDACAICGGTTRLCVDHCHDTGIVRGLLCSACNFGIGHFANDPERLLKAAAYLA